MLPKEGATAATERVVRMPAGGGLLFCTSHFVQEPCSMEELVFAFDAAHELFREVCER